MWGLGEGIGQGWQDTHPGCKSGTLVAGIHGDYTNVVGLPARPDGPHAGGLRGTLVLRWRRRPGAADTRSSSSRRS
jgi:hypothetical protein